MKILVYEADDIVPIKGLYEWLGDSGSIIFSNAEQKIQNFDSREVIRLLGSIHFDTVIFYIPLSIQNQFVKLVNQQFKITEWQEDNTVKVSSDDIGLIGKDELSQFFDRMVLKRVIKPNDLKAIFSKTEVIEEKLPNQAKLSDQMAKKVLETGNKQASQTPLSAVVMIIGTMVVVLMLALSFKQYKTLLDEENSQLKKVVTELQNSSQKITTVNEVTARLEEVVTQLNKNSSQEVTAINELTTQLEEVFTEKKLDFAQLSKIIENFSQLLNTSLETKNELSQLAGNMSKNMSNQKVKMSD
jgi:hypothetical protein